VAKLPRLEASGILASELELPLSSGRSDLPTQTSVESEPAAVQIQDLWSADQLILTIPPGREPSSLVSYPAAVLSALLAYRRSQASGRIIFTSSIGVYGKGHGLALDRDTLPKIENGTARQAALLLAESHVAVQSQRPHRILRLGGLYGGDRHPGKYMAKLAAIPRPDEPINLVSRDCVIREMMALLDQPFWSGTTTFNVVDPEHPSRGEYYAKFRESV